jgi:hypothetical protein
MPGSSTTLQQQGTDVKDTAAGGDAEVAVEMVDRVLRHVLGGT